MMRWKVEITIHRPVDEIFGFVSEMRNDPVWWYVAPEVIKAPEGGPRLGSVYHLMLKRMGMGAVWKYNIVEFNPPSHMAWTFTIGKMASGRGSYALEESGESTRLVLANEWSLNGVLRFLEPLRWRSHKKHSEIELRKLKRYLESQAAHDRR